MMYARMLVLATGLLAAGFATAAEQPQPPMPPSPKGPAVIVRAVFIAEDGTQLTGKPCFADNVDAKGGPGLHSDANGVVVNPHTEIDANGRLNLQIPESFLSKARTFTVFCALDPMSDFAVVQGRTADGRTGNLAYQLGPNQKEVDLGQVQVSKGKAKSEATSKQ